jgi:hypothetical protein
MSGQLVWKFKWFWDDADHVIERWLQDMASQGLHLQRISCLRILFVFKRGEPADVTYRIDLLLTRKNSDYDQLFIDAGWEHVDQLLGWQYWRTPTREGRTPEIFTDVESQIKKYRRLVWMFAFAWMPAALILPFKRSLSVSDVASDPILLVLAGFTLYSVMRLVRRIRQLREQDALRR